MAEQNDNDLANMLETAWIQPLLDWFSHQARDLPWRLERDPYRIWLSEIMLQQTQVQTVEAYYRRFLDRFPQLTDLARADEQEVLKLWEGLGYYSRARNLLKTARLIESHHQGVFPDQQKDLLALPGIGPYTAGALLSIAFGQAVPAVDGNVVRVLSRLLARSWNPKLIRDRKQVHNWLAPRMPVDSPGAFNEALMDCGATLCLPRQAACPACPLTAFCQAYAQDAVEAYPLQAPGRPLPRQERVVLILSSGPLFHVIQRPDRGLLAGLYTFNWLHENLLADMNRTDQPIQVLQKQTGARIQPLPPLVHSFTHLIWQLEPYWVQLPQPDLTDTMPFLKPFGQAGAWLTAEELAALPFPRAMDRLRQHVLALT